MGEKHAYSNRGQLWPESVVVFQVSDYLQNKTVSGCLCYIGTNDEFIGHLRMQVSKLTA